MNLEKVSLICKSLSDANRLKIVKSLTSGEKCACSLLEELNVTQPTLSHHMKSLSECHLVNVRKEGKWSYYSLDCKTLSSYRDFIASLVCNQYEGGCQCKSSGN